MTHRSDALAPTALPDAPRRLVVYAFFDKDGQVDDYVVHSLNGLRPHAAHIMVVANGSLTASSRATLEATADQVLVRENEGFDIGAHRAALRHLGDTVREFDEIVLTNDTWFGPVRSWDPVFARMDREACHFWGLTDHAPSRSNPFTRGGRAPYHLQSYWIAVRRAMFESADWARYWDRLPALRTYVHAVIEHELRFTAHFTSHGWAGAAAFPYERFDTENPSLFEAERLIERGCPVLKRRPLFHWPPLLDSYGSVGAWTLEAATAEGYPLALILGNLARTVPPKAMNVDAGLLTVLPKRGDTPEDVSPVDRPRILVIVHSDGAPVDAAIERAEVIAGGYDLVVTTSDADARRSIEAELALRRPVDRRTEARTVPAGTSEAGALLVGCRDILLAGEHDLIVRLRATGADAIAPGRLLSEHGHGNLLPDAEYFAAMLSEFRREPSLGIVYPPMLHIGQAALGSSWGSLRTVFETTARAWGITVPLDDVSPLAPSGGMFVARIEALRLLVESPLTYEQVAATAGLAPALEKMWSYAAGQLGYHTRTIASRDYLALSHTLLEYEFNQTSLTIPGASFEKIDFLRHSGAIGTGAPRDLLRMYVRRRHRWLLRIVRRLNDPARLPGRLRRHSPREIGQGTAEP